MALVVTGLVSLLVDFGIGIGLVQFECIEGESLNDRFRSGFFFTCASGFIASILMFFPMSYVISWFYHEEALVNISKLLSINVLVNSLSIIPAANLTRDLKFKELAIADILSVFLGAIAAVIVAYLGGGIWSLITLQLVSVSAKMLSLWFFCGFAILKGIYSFGLMTELLSFGIKVLGTRLLFFIRTNFDSVLIGSILGANMLGIYTLAFTITETLRSQIAGIISRVMLPIYSRMQNDSHGIAILYLKVTRLMTLTMFPFFITIVLYSKDIIEMLFSSEWSSAAFPAALLAVSGLIYSVSGPSIEVLQGIGRPSAILRISFINLIFVAMPLTWYLTYRYGVIGSSVAVIASFAFQRTLSHLKLKSILNITEIDIFVAILPSIIGLIICYIFYIIFDDNYGVLIKGAFNFIVFIVISTICFKHQINQQFSKGI